MSEMQEYIIRICDLLDSLGEKFDFLDRLGLGEEGMSLSKVFRSNLTEFLMYLSASDGVVNQAETDFINENLGYQFSPEKINRQIERSDFYAMDYESKLPQAFAFAAVMDDAMERLGVELEAKLSDVMIDAYTMTGRAFLECDGEVTQDEINDLKVYIGMLEHHIAENKQEAEGKNEE